MSRFAVPGLVAKAIFHRALLFGAGWAILVGGDSEGMLLGAVMVPLAIHLSLRLLQPRHPLDLWRLALHVPRFVSGSIIGGVDVARRAFAPSMPLQPGWLVAPVSLPDGASAVLGAELSLLPGTLSAGMHEGQLIVHVLDTDVDFGMAIAGEVAEFAALIGHNAPPLQAAMGSE